MNSIKCTACGFVGWSNAESCKKCGLPLRLHSIDGTQHSPTDYGNREVWDQPPRLELQKGVAIASLVVGIVSFLTLTLFGLAAITGIILGLVALSRANGNPLRYGGKGLAIAGLVLSISSFVIVVPIGIIAAIAVPNLLAARRAANEGSSITSLRQISAAEAAYYDVHQRFGTLEQLAAEQLVNPSLASGRNGYKFRVEVLARDRSDEPGFEAVAVPISYPDTGRRSFYIDETGIMRMADARGDQATRYDSPLNVEGRSPGRSYERDAEY
jgi:type IV pilus assembly protein PilA